MNNKSMPSDIDRDRIMIEIILNELSYLITDHEFRLFTPKIIDGQEKFYAATTDQDLLKNAMLKTVELENQSQAKIHQRSKEALWLWLIVYCTKRLHKKFNSLCYGKDIERCIKYQEVIRNAIVRAINYSLSKIGEEVRQHFATGESHNFIAGQGSLKTYVYKKALFNTDTALKKLANELKKELNVIFVSSEDMANFPDPNRGDEEVEKIDDEKIEQMIKEVIFEYNDNNGDKLSSKFEDNKSRVTYEKIKGELNDIIRKNQDAFEMFLLRYRDSKTLVEIAEHFEVSKATVQRKTERFMQKVCDLNFC